METTHRPFDELRRRDRLTRSSAQKCRLWGPVAPQPKTCYGASGTMSDPPAPPVEERHSDVLAGPIRLRTTEWSVAGAEGRTAIIALPGALAPRSSLAPIGKLLGQQFRFIALDLPGLGESEKPAPTKYEYSPARFAESLTDLMGGLGLARAHVFGHGLGGAAAIHLAARRPELVRTIALVSPMGPSGAVPAPLRLLLAPIVGEIAFRQLMSQRLYARHYRARIHSTAEPSEISDNFLALASPASRAALLALLRNSVDTRSIIADCRRLRCPTLLLWGRTDRLMSLQLGRMLAREIPGTGFEILDAGHAPHRELPEQTAALLRRFYSGERAR